jgi:hypothetical protein
MGASPMTTVEVNRTAICQPMKFLRVNLRGVESAIRSEF